MKKVFTRPYENINDRQFIIGTSGNSIKPIWFLFFVGVRRTFSIRKRALELAKLLNVKLNFWKLRYINSAQFYVSAQNIRRHSLETYKKLYQWIMNCEDSSYYIGLHFEFIWHFILTGKHIDPSYSY